MFEQLRVIFGVLIWLIVGILAGLNVIEVGLVEQLFLLAPLAIIPLGLRLIKIPAQAKRQQQLYGLIRIAQPMCALAVVIAFVAPTGMLAGLLAASWFGLTGLMALLGLTRFIGRGLTNPVEGGSEVFDRGAGKARPDRGRGKLCPYNFLKFWTQPLAEISSDVGLIYVAVGGGWLVLARLGLNPLGFADLVVLLTAVHFHYAGFAAPIMASMTGRELAKITQTTPRLYRISVLGIMAGTPIVAAGITFSPLLELMGAVILATSLAILAYLIILVALQAITHRPAQILLSLAAICLIAGMGLTYAYALGEFSGQAWVVIPDMVRFHGIANALGFGLGGLLAWNILPESG